MPVPLTLDKKRNSLAAYVCNNVHLLNGKAKYFKVEGDFESIIIDKHKLIESHCTDSHESNELILEMKSTGANP